MKLVNIKIFKLQILYDTLNRLWANKHQISGNLTLQIAKLMHTIKLELDSVENSRQSAIIRHGDVYKDETGKIEIPPDSIEFSKFKLEYEVILNSEFSVEFSPIKHDDISSVNLDPVVYINLVEFGFLEV